MQPAKYEGLFLLQFVFIGQMMTKYTILINYVQMYMHISIASIDMPINHYHNVICVRVTISLYPFCLFFCILILTKSHLYIQRGRTDFRVLNSYNSTDWIRKNRKDPIQPKNISKFIQNIVNGMKWISPISQSIHTFQSSSIKVK